MKNGSRFIIGLERFQTGLSANVNFRIASVWPMVAFCAVIFHVWVAYVCGAGRVGSRNYLIGRRRHEPKNSLSVA